MQFNRLTWVAGAALVLCSGLAQAGNTTATLTADNEFWLYSGNATGTALQFVGDGHNWGAAFTFNFTVTAGDYLYVLANDGGPPKSWEGVFSTTAGMLHSNSTDWLGSGVASGTTAVTQALIAGASWSAPTLSTYGWGNVVGDVDAKWIWMADQFNGPQTTLYRSAAPVMAAVPEAQSYSMLLGGLVVLGLLARRRKSVNA
jgi:hypothetical protein